MMRQEGFSAYIFHWFLLFNICLTSTNGFIPTISTSSFKANNIPLKRNKRMHNVIPLFSGYLPPEKDPEYKSMMKKSLWAPELLDEIDDINFLPNPKEGDIVLCPSLWRDEKVLGLLRNIFYKNETWLAEVLPLTEGKSNGVYIIDKDAKYLEALVIDTAPVKAYFVRAENAYNISTTLSIKLGKNVSEPVLRAPGYRVLDSTFVLPKKSKSSSVIDLEGDMEAYESLKSRIVLDSLKTGGALSLLAWPLGGLTIGLSYSLGSLFGSAYLYLLGKRVDTIGSGVSTSQASRGISKRDELLANSRFLMPLLLMLTLSAKNLFLDPEHVNVGSMHLLSREEFLAAIAGLLTNRLSLFYTEVLSQMSQADWLSFLPGSFAEAFRQKELLQGSASSNLIAAVPQQDLITVVCVSGPTAGGREAVTEKLSELYAGSLETRKKKEFPRSKLDLRPCVLVTTDTSLVKSRPDKYRLVSSEEFTNAESRALFVGNYKRLFGPDSSVALLAEDLSTAGATGGRGAVPVYLVEGSSDLIDSLSKQEKIRLLSVWISLQTKEQFVAKAKEMIQTQLKSIDRSKLPSGGDDNLLASLCATKMVGLVDEAARDVTYYMRRAPLFEYTLLNSESDEATAAELLQLLDSTFQ